MEVGFDVMDGFVLVCFVVVGVVLIVDMMSDFNEKMIIGFWGWCGGYMDVLKLKEEFVVVSCSLDVCVGSGGGGKCFVCMGMSKFICYDLE